MKLISEKFQMPTKKTLKSFLLWLVVFFSNWTIFRRLLFTAWLKSKWLLSVRCYHLSLSPDWKQMFMGYIFGTWLILWFLSLKLIGMEFSPANLWSSYVILRYHSMTWKRQYLTGNGTKMRQRNDFTILETDFYCGQAREYQLIVLYYKCWTWFASNGNIFWYREADYG